VPFIRREHKEKYFNLQPIVIPAGSRKKSTGILNAQAMPSSPMLALLIITRSSTAFLSRTIPIETS
jgi:hypothetical protein